MQLSAVELSRSSIPYPDYFADSMRQLQILAGAVIEIGSDLRISPYLSDTSQPTLGLPLRRGHYR